MSASNATCIGAGSQAPKPLLLLDISRLVLRANRAGPSGIDRIDLAYAQHYLSGKAQRPVVSVINFLGFLIGIRTASAKHFVDDLAKRWQQNSRLDANQVHRHRLELALSFARLFLAAIPGMADFRRELRRALGRNGQAPIFLVASHHHLSRDHAMVRIRRVYGVRCVCFLHDLLPLEYPEYFRAGWELKGERLARSIARHFDAVLANSQATAHSMRKFLNAGGHDPAPVLRVALPGVPALPCRAPNDISPDRGYFVMLGTIEPRKNHLLILNLWTRLADEMPEPPLLVVIGARGWENEQVVDMLERSSRLQKLVIERNHLADSEVGALLIGARALLMPSFVEGFGLPLAESLVLGVPALCSDIPALREVGGNVPEYLDPLAILAWKEAVLAYYSNASARRNLQMERLNRWQAPSWADHFEVVEETLDEVCRPGWSLTA